MVIKCPVCGSNMIQSSSEYNICVLDSNEKIYELKDVEMPVLTCSDCIETFITLKVIAENDTITLKGEDYGKF